MGDDHDVEFISEIYIVEMDVVLAEPNHFGASDSPGKLVLRARLMDATLRCQQQTRKSHSPQLHECTVRHNGKAHHVNGVSVGTHLELVTADNVRRWTRQSTKDAEYIRPGSAASVKLSLIEVARDELNSFALILSPY